MFAARKSSPLSFFSTRLLEQIESEDEEERRIKMNFSLALMKHADQEGKDLEVTYSRILTMLKADVDYPQVRVG